MNRYDELFATSATTFVPFLVVGDPNPNQFLDLVDTVIAAGAGALELGLPFTDPVADGPVIQRAHIRAFDAGVNTDEAFDLIRKVRDRHPGVPIGLLTYANLVDSLGPSTFYARAAESGADSVLVADVPLREGGRFAQVANAHGVDPIFIAPPAATKDTLAEVAEKSAGYVYVTSRAGVTGVDQEARWEDLQRTLGILNDLKSAPPVVGFGISKPEHVRQVFSLGAKGAISGSAVVAIVEQHHDDPQTLQQQITDFVSAMSNCV
ncbi:MAG: tryptophan synthase subunit alpha [Actinomycetaceae bacterium]|nr:tryptophan synthase subunit alpha [Actinomycetaceae bacterium]